MNLTDVYEDVIALARPRGTPMFVNLGTERLHTVEPGGWVEMTCGELPCAMVIYAVSLVVFDWEPEPLRWYWRRRFTRWLLRKLRRLPPLQSAPVSIDMRVGRELAFSRVGAMKPTGGTYPTGMPLLAPVHVHLAARVYNESDRPLRVAVAVVGNAVG